jgi:ankyrin repeat protein
MPPPAPSTHRTPRRRQQQSSSPAAQRPIRRRQQQSSARLTPSRGGRGGGRSKSARADSPVVARKETLAVADDANNECAVCLTEQRVTRLRPCGHAVTCTHCTLRMVSVDDEYGLCCPLCKQHVKTIEWYDVPLSAVAGSRLATFPEHDLPLPSPLPSPLPVATGSSPPGTPPGLRRLPTYDACPPTCDDGAISVFSLQAFVQAAANDDRDAALRARAEELQAAWKSEEMRQLRACVLSGDFEEARRLHEAGVPLAEADGRDLVQHTCITGSVDTLRFLVEAAGSWSPTGGPRRLVEAADADGLTPMYHGSRNGHVEVMALLVAHGVSLDEPVNEEEETALHVACEHGQLAVVQAHLTGQAIAAATLCRGTESSRLRESWGRLLSKANRSGEQPVHAAARACDSHERLRGRRGDWRFFRLLKLLLDEGADVHAEDRCGITPLLACCGVGRERHSEHGSLNSRFAKMQLLLERGASANAEVRSGPSAGCTALAHTASLAANCGEVSDATPHYEAAARLLLKHGADVDRSCRSFHGATPLIIASENGCVSMAKLLLDGKASLDLERPDGASPLLMACHGGHSGVVRLLLGRGVAVDKAAWDDGSTPLLMACQKGHEECVRLLLEYGARPNFVSPAARLAESQQWAGGDEYPLDDKLPLVVARTNGHTAVALLLESHGAVEVDCPPTHPSLTVPVEPGNVEPQCHVSRHTPLAPDMPPDSHSGVVNTSGVPRGPAAASTRRRHIYGLIGHRVDEEGGGAGRSAQTARL